MKGAVVQWENSCLAPGLIPPTALTNTPTGREASKRAFSQLCKVTRRTATVAPPDEKNNPNNNFLVCQLKFDLFFTLYKPGEQ